MGKDKVFLSSLASPLYLLFASSCRTKKKKLPRVLLRECCHFFALFIAARGVAELLALSGQTHCKRKLSALAGARSERMHTQI